MNVTDYSTSHDNKIGCSTLNSTLSDRITEHHNSTSLIGRLYELLTNLTQERIHSCCYSGSCS